MFNRLSSIILLGLAVLGLGVAGADAKLGFGYGGYEPMSEEGHAALAEAALTRVIRPGYEDFAVTTAVLKKRTDTLCQAPSPDALRETKAAFAAAVESWSKIEILRFGPVTADERYERLFFWPDPRAIGLRQAQRVLAKKDESVTSPDTLAKKSVALQGFPAFEFLLYGKGAEGLIEKSEAGVFRCRFAAAVAANIAKIAKNVEEAWGPDAPFTQGYLAPGPHDPAYRTPKGVTLELFKAFSAGIELVRDQKLAKPLGASLDRARPRLAAFWRSGLTFPNMAGNLKGVRALFVDGGLAAVVETVSPGIEKSVLFDLDRVIRVLAAETEPIAEVVRDPAERNQLEALRVALKSARGTASSLIAEGAGLSFGFNAMDGD